MSTSDDFRKIIDSVFEDDYFSKDLIDDSVERLKDKEPSLTVYAEKDAIVAIYRELSSFMTADDDNDRPRLIDLKPYFRNSSKVKYKKDGGWYLVVPVGGQQKASILRSAYTQKIWKQVQNVTLGSTGSGTYHSVDPHLVERIQQKLGTSQRGVIPALQYQWKSASVTRTPYGRTQTRSHYLTFRTVSDKSDPSSWIIGRQNATQLNNVSLDGQKQDELREVITDILLSYLEKADTGDDN